MEESNKIDIDDKLLKILYKWYTNYIFLNTFLYVLYYNESVYFY